MPAKLDIKIIFPCLFSRNKLAAYICDSLIVAKTFTSKFSFNFSIGISKILPPIPIAALLIKQSNFKFLINCLSFSLVISNLKHLIFNI